MQDSKNTLTDIATQIHDLTDSLAKAYLDVTDIDVRADIGSVFKKSVELHTEIVYTVERLEYKIEQEQEKQIKLEEQEAQKENK